jgi:Leucine-rich repeat (LRR) protein
VLALACSSVLCCFQPPRVTTTTTTSTTTTTKSSSSLSTSCQVGQGAIVTRQDLLNTLNLTETQLQSETYIQFPSNSVSCLSPNLFNGLSNITDLYLRFQPRLTKLQSNVFNGLSSLTYLYLWNNKLTTIESNAFQGLSSLTQLDLAGNGLSSIQSNTFANLTRLNWLNLSGNPLISIEPGSFYNLPQLDYLDLSSTQLPVTLDHSLFSSANIMNTASLTIDFSDNSWSSFNSNLCDLNAKCYMDP